MSIPRQFFACLLVVATGCSDEQRDSPGTDFDTPYDDGQGVDQLEDSDFAALCANVLGHIADRVDRAEQERIACTLAGVLNESTESDCEGAVSTCMASRGAVDLCQTSPDLGECNVTIGQLEACVNAQSQWLVTLSDTLDCTLASDSAALEALASQAPVECEPLVTQCAGRFVEDLGIDVPIVSDEGADAGPDVADEIGDGSDLPPDSLPDISDEIGDDLRDDPDTADEELGSDCDVLYVDIDATGSETGLDWIDAFVDLQDALAEAALGACTEIWVAEGTYRPATSDGDRTTAFELIDGVSLYGGFAGDELRRGDRQPDVNASILSGDLNGDDDGFTSNEENSYQIVRATDVDRTARIDGFVIEGGNATGDQSEQTAGGGLLATRASPTVVAVTFRDNRANFGGGLSAREGASPLVRGCRFTGNDALIAGGGLESFGSSPTVLDCHFEANTTVSGGGAIAFGGADNGLVVDSRFVGNSASIYGGAIRIGGTTSFSDATVVNNLFVGNSAGAHGGAIYLRNPDTNPLFVNNVFSGNSAFMGAAVINTQAAAATFVNNSFSNNVATGTGGAWANAYSFTSTADDLPAGNPTLVNCILFGNQDGGGVEGASQFYLQSGEPSVTYSVIEAASPVAEGMGNIDIDPGFVDANGDDDVPGTLDDDLRLGAESAAIDAGDNTLLPADLADLDGDGDVEEAIPLDADGSPRRADHVSTTDTGNGTAPIVDIGAYERLP